MKGTLRARLPKPRPFWLGVVSLPLLAFPLLGAAPWSHPAGATVTSVPAAPSELMAFGLGQTEVGLEWNDNSDSPTEFRIEQKTLNGAFRDVIGALGPSAIITGLSRDTIYTFRVRARNAAGDSPYSNEVTFSTSTNTLPCQPGPEILCIQNERFRVKTFWRVGQGSYMAGQAVPLTADTGYFWFFAPSNVEMVVKVLNGCALNLSYWVFAGGLTDVDVVWTVTDTSFGVVKTYVNPPGTRFAPVQDTQFQVTLCP